MILYDPKTREQWLECRSHGIGGSEAAAAIGRNKYMSNVDLWRLKTHRDKAPDLSDNPAVQYGKQAEEHLRALFALNHPEFSIEYHEYRMYADDKEHWLYATLDGELTHKETGERGVLEIKTATMQNSMQWDEWSDQKIPQNYYIQLLHQMLATGRSFCKIFADLRYFDKEAESERDHAHRIITRTVRISDPGVADDMKMLLEKEREFWDHVLKDVQPPRIIPMFEPKSI